MTAKELLSRIIKIRKAIDYRKTKIDALVANVENTTSHLTGMPHNPNPDTSAMAKIICQKVELEREIQKLESERKAHIAKFDLLEDEVLSRILNLRYAQEEKWDDIMAIIGYGPAQVYRLHRTAIGKLEKILRDDSK